MKKSISLRKAEEGTINLVSFGNERCITYVWHWKTISRKTIYQVYQLDISIVIYNILDLK